jgi:hypothetical protein
VAVVADLGARVDLLPRLAIAGTEIAVVEHQHVEPGQWNTSAKAQGIEVKDRGWVPAELVVRFKAAATGQ